MKNVIDRQITRHSLPTRMGFNFFYPQHKNFEIQPAAQTAHLVLPDTQADPSQNQKSRFLPRF